MSVWSDSMALSLDEDTKDNQQNGVRSDVRGWSRHLLVCDDRS